MPCYHPLRAYRSSSLTVNGKPCIKILSDEQYRSLPVYSDSSRVAFIDPVTGFVSEVFPLRCGKCVGCRLDYSRSWADRCVMESLCYDAEKCWFITLTYDDDCLPVSSCNDLYKLINYDKLFPEFYSNGYKFDDYAVDACGRRIDRMVFHNTLVPKDMQDFMKRLRIHYQRKFNHDGIRFYLAGEYGDKSARPHYHMIAFNLPLYDATYYAKSFDGHVLYNSSCLESLWGKGYVVVGECNWHTCAYTARYVMKKLKGRDAVKYTMHGIEPEFVRMSRKPGIGVPYFETHIDDIYALGSDHVPLGHIYLPDGKIVDSPRIFDDKFVKMFSDGDLLISLLKNKRSERAQAYNRDRMSRTDLDEESYFNLREISSQSAAKKLLRTL